jgi:hypothetical protein
MTLQGERVYWVMLAMVPGIGPIRFKNLLELCGGGERAWNASGSR